VNLGNPVNLAFCRARGPNWEERRTGSLIWHDSRRLRSTLGYMSPMQYEQPRIAGQPKTANL
jgi:hypothetical protein